jgi:hypothetical protein
MGCTITSSKPDWVAEINERPSRLRVVPDQTSVLARVGRTPLILKI